MGDYKVSCLCNVNVSDKESEVKLTQNYLCSVDTYIQIRL